MRDNKMYLAAALALLLLFPHRATAATVWDESVNGDLSNDPLLPTTLTLAPGPNDVIGQAGGAPGPDALAPFDQDFFTFTIPAGYELRSLTPVRLHLSTLQGDEFAFIGIQGGAQITHGVSPPSFGGDAKGLLGWLHVPASDQGADILPAMGAAGNGATGFTGPLGAGRYSVWVQDDHPLSYDYSFDVAAVPEPSAWGMMLVGFGWLGLAARRRRAACRV